MGTLKRAESRVVSVCASLALSIVGPGASAPPNTPPDARADGPADAPAGWLNVRDLGASGSEFETTARTTAGSKQITVADAGDFQPGQGVVLSKCRHCQDKRHIWGPRQEITWAKDLGDKAELRGYDGT